ncbi:MAG: FG-GAP-like repeat-containing protein [Candidatus Acidiferrales bacterium]
MSRGRALQKVAIGALLVGLLGVPASLLRGRQQESKSQNLHRSAEALRLNNLGVAYMDRQQSEEALKSFEKAYALDQGVYIARLNQGIALLNLQRLDDARKILLEVVQKQPDNLHAWYNLGLLAKAQGRAEDAIAAFEHVASIDSDDADTQYFLGLLHSQLQQYSQAIAAFERAIALNPFHVSAEFGLAQAYQRSGNVAAARQHLDRFQHLNAEKLGAPMSFVYGEQGKYSRAEQATPALSPALPPIPVRFVDVTRDAGLPTTTQSADAIRWRREPVKPGAVSSLGSGVCVFDYDGDGLPDIFLVNATGDNYPALLRNEGNRHFKDVTAASRLNIPAPGIGCAAGDYDNDGHTDLAVSFNLNGRVSLFHNQGDGTFGDVTDSAGIGPVGLARSLAWVDYDHDGDLDLYVTSYMPSALMSHDHEHAPGTGNVLWRNNGNGTFTNATEETGLGVSPSGIGVVASDINNDRAIDFVVTGYDLASGSPAPPAVLFNPREGQFKKSEPWSAAVPSPTAGVTALDFDKDGWMDIAFTHWTSPAVTLWRNVEGKRFDPVALPKLDWTRAWGITALDYDNDGWIDLAAVGEDNSGGHVALFRNEGPAGFRDVTKDVGLDKIQLTNPRAIVAFDYDGDGATDLLITQNFAPPVLLRNQGANKNNWMQLALKGEHDNKNAIGTKVEVYAGAMRQKWEVPGAYGYLSQGPAEVHVGLGAAREADIVRMLWPTGVLQDEVSLRAGSSHLLAEIDRRGSSCPIVFVWNGRRYEFLADIIGPGIVGHWIGPNQRNVPDPNEYLKVAGSEVRPRNGKISFKLLEPMEELDYLDQVRLVAVDHPVGVEVYPNEYFASNPPFPEFKVIASQGARPPVGAWDDKGRDVLPLLLERDRKYVMDFPDEPFQGFAAMHTLELDLGPWDPSHPLRLLMDGFTDYFTANSMYAAWQAGIQPLAPYVEALDSSGKWLRVIDDMGFPAGLARTMIADLTGKLPAGTRRIRIVTNLKVYWDRIRVDNSSPELPYRLSEVPLASGRLEFRGYPRVVEGNPRNDITYIYEDVSLTGPYTRQAGNYTRYGDVRELVEKTDEKYAIYGSGDEVSTDFDPSHLPALPAGWARDYFFYADGFAKDMDFYAAYGDTVAPLPFHTLVPYPYPANISYPYDAEHLKYFIDYNTRPVSGPPGNSFQFRYPSGSPR